ncbi:tetratricopeptide repeat protein 37 [Spodoptera litura]|uniref:Tetratricopeptide repeat protein 37 n=1 Tax=Spodoptera litura TaxID=69820 RepID=A0A9J7IQ98_SPOLT|nr:tetratricopeptide repeat protein 37 [Spodoptera litura]
MADIKALLKDARKLIDEKNFKEAQECCKNILRKDKQNYFGLVLLGKSLQDSDQAPLAYQKAIASKPDHPLAWQGLANYYERIENESNKIKLITVYNEMLNLPMEEEKTTEIITKLGQLGCALKSKESLKMLATYLTKDLPNTLCHTAEKHFIDLLKADIPSEEDTIPLILNVLQKLYKDDPRDSLEILQCKLIIQKPNLASAVEEIISLKFFPSNVLLREWLCKQLCIKYVEKMSFCELNIEQHIDTISEGIMNSKYPSLLRSMICFDKGLYLEAYKQCVPLVNYQEADVTEATFIIKCTIMLKKWSVTQKLATNFMTKVKDQHFAVVLKRFLFLSLTKQQKWKQSINIAKDIAIDSMEPFELASLAECYIEANEPVDHVLKHLETTDYYKQLQALLLQKQNKYDEVIKLLKESENSIEVYYLGKAYWEMKQYDKCLMSLLKAAKLNPDHADTFLYLGHYYYHHKSDLQKAKKCYEKAHSLNAISMNIAKSLSEIYVKLQQKDADFELLNGLAKNISTTESWVNFRLGLHYLNKREWENAILNFRNVIKNNQSDTTAFECLADAYYSRGSYTSALRAYNKVMTLDPSKSAHCLTRIGHIYSLLTQYQEAISTFEKVFIIEPYSFLALKGISETWMRVAKKKIEANMYGSARDCAQYAIDYITKALSKQNQYLCFWKLLADNLMFITKLPDKYSFVYMPQLSKEGGENFEITKKTKLEIFPQAIACYSHIAKQKQQVSSYDLALAYLSFYHETKKVVNCHIAFNLTLNCIKEGPTVWRNWNLLGKICLAIKKYEIAQHCFIKALSVTRKWSVAKIWCNLGTLYLKLKLYKLSNYCFSRGQSALPSHPHSWIGQGLIAEAIREEEAMDLFRHASRLGYHPESALGYADWVCRTLKNNKYKDNSESKYEIEGLFAIPYAIDLVEWYCNFQPTDACAYNLMGILQERFGLLRSAIQSYEKAFKYAEDENKNKILLNIGRIFVRLERYDEAIKIFKAITEASFDSTTGLALALYKKGLYEESYSVYDTALHWLSNEDAEKADLLVAMAGIVYMYKGADDAKTLLFHSIQIAQKKPTAHSLFAICSLGLIHSDQSLSKLALGELRKYEMESEYGFDIGFLKSYLSVCEDNMDQAIKLLSDCLHDHPSNALLWFCMAQYCLRSADTMAKVASCCAQKALCSAHYGEYDCDFGKILASASIAEHIAGDRVKAMLLAKEGLHKYPNQPEIWAALLFSLLSHNIWMENKTWLLGASGYMRKYLNMSRPLGRWVNLMEKKLGKTL